MENMTDFEAALKILAGAENNQARNFKWSHHHSSNSAASWESRMSCKLRRTLYTIYEDDFETLAELGFDYRPSLYTCDNETLADAAADSP